MAAETDLDHLQKIGYVILKHHIKPQLMKETQAFIKKRVRAVMNISSTEHYVSLYKTFDDWLMKCKRLYHKTMIDSKMTLLKTHND